MSTAKFLSTENLGPWLEKLSEKRRVVAPVKENDAVVFRPYSTDATLCLEKVSTVSPKGILFPRSEPLMAFRYVKDPENPGQVKLDVQETVKAEPTVIVGARPCDVAGFKVIDRVYTDPEHTDKYYAARRDKAAFVVLACTQPDSSCFCNWVGGDPAGTDGVDVLLTPVTGGYVADAISPLGQELVDTEHFRAADDTDLADAKAAHKAAREALGEKTDLSNIQEKVLDLFEDEDFWTDITSKCLSCGACSYVCPTCYCFNITDESKGNVGTRIRSWDNCMSALFTLEGSGHNPRAGKLKRFRNRVGHKFSYYPEDHDGALACVGCGRCVRSCPVGMDIREILKKALKSEPAAKEAVND
ncbi:4Fe-4S dicluster domain-containing protein [Desulfobaculum bizertense]|uniref:4Fe-4S dicluster domain-containing protein n=1 Tax=Desulfobaculum bizertense DSM 18034 TaxID=1121442 RepID=A0A1T4W8X9_9BACT|nr:4Fe-4S dicluster domain-containing protein [Desulfobaculum bizertense]UIJ39183.1 4Fe-4S dicluster domain-containing protein [Desulfobaculum bizertense]SKA73498.1 4Fe-4S dicluster domain-containing protein [Desulfobaculum bizertense DSM 18034]